MSRFWRGKKRAFSNWLIESSHIQSALETSWMNIIITSESIWIYIENAIETQLNCQLCYCVHFRFIFPLIRVSHLQISATNTMPTAMMKLSNERSNGPHEKRSKCVWVCTPNGQQELLCLHIDKTKTAPLFMTFQWNERTAYRLFKKLTHTHTLHHPNGFAINFDYRIFVQ